LRELAEGKLVVFVTKRAKEILVENALRCVVGKAFAKARDLSGKTVATRGIKQTTGVRRWKLTQRFTAWPRRGWNDGMRIKRNVNRIKRKRRKFRGECNAMRAWRERGRTRAGKIGDMRDDVVVERIFVMPVAGPIARVDVYFDIAAKCAFVAADADDGVQKIRASFKVPRAGFNDFDFFAGFVSQIFRPQRRVVPNALQVALRPRARRLVRRGFAERGNIIGLATNVEEMRVECDKVFHFTPKRPLPT